MTYNVSYWRHSCRADGTFAVSMQHETGWFFAVKWPSTARLHVTWHGVRLRLHVTRTRYARDGSYSVTSWVYKGQDLVQSGRVGVGWEQSAVGETWRVRMGAGWEQSSVGEQRVYMEPVLDTVLCAVLDLTILTCNNLPVDIGIQ